MRDSDRCWSHDPSFKEKRHRSASRAARTGGRGRPSSELKRLAERFEDLSERVLSEQDPLDPKVGAVAGQLLNYARACIRDRLTAEDVEEVRGRMEALEEALEAHNRSRRPYGV